MAHHSAINSIIFAQHRIASDSIYTPYNTVNDSILVLSRKKCEDRHSDWACDLGESDKERI